MAMAASPRRRKQNKPEAETAQETIQGTVNRRIFYNAENGYCVLSVSAGDLDDIKVTGNMPSVRECDEYKFTGSWIDHPKFGLQFRFTEHELILPSGKAGLARYLSNVTYGVGAIKAQRIVDALGEDALSLIKENPGILESEKLSFLDERQRNDIIADLSQNSIQAELAGMICRDGIGMGTVAKIMAKYGSDAVKIVKENPYLLAEELYNIGFLKADVIAQATGIAPNSPFRVEAAVDYTLRESGNEGHVFLKPSVIVPKLIGKKGIIEASGVGIPDIAAANGKLIAQGKCVREGDAIYATELYEAEVGVAAAVRNILAAKPKSIENLDSHINDIEQRDSIEYAQQQKQAVSVALQNSLSVLCGGPGTGKSTISKAICDIYKRLNPHNEIYLAAPTGRAAKRLSEATGRGAKTIHRLLCYSPHYGGFEFNENNKLPGPALLVVDEVSMVDLQLAHNLFSALGDDIQVVFVGDPQQLPSVGPGSVLRDLISCDVVPTVRLAYNYRQATGSVISHRASVICRGVTPELQSDGDWMFIPVDSAAMAAETTLQIVRTLKAERGLLDWLCLAPMYRGDAGITKINDGIRDIINPKNEGGEGQAELGGFRVGDKILCTKNLYLLSLYNGDMGVVRDVGKGEIIADFGDPCVNDNVKIAYEHLECFKPGYAISIHKAQGSEVPVVVMVLTKQNFVMLTREIFYTGITRARNQLILIADEAAVKMAVKNNKVQERFSMLAERIRKGR